MAFAFRVSLLIATSLAATAALAPAQTTTAPTREGVLQPAPSPTPRITYSVKIRAWDLFRQNASDATQAGANTAVNQAAFNLGIAPHVEYHMWKGLSAGSTYQYANPLNGDCDTEQSHLSAPCKVVVSKGQLPGGSALNFDDTVPGYRLNTLYEAYLTWKDPHLYVKAGNQVLNTPWAPNADSRIKPNAYQGADATYTFDNHWLLQGTRIVRFEFRNQSEFSRSTLLTSTLPGAGGIPTDIYDPGAQPIQSSGYAMGRLGYTNGSLDMNLWYYGFLDIANAYWFDGKYTFSNVRFSPYVAAQMGSEQNSGKALVGKVDSQVYGVSSGINVTKNVLVEVAYDHIPLHTSTVELPNGYTCASNAEIAVGTVTKSLPYFLPSGGTANCSNNLDGTTNLYYGGWASPYSDSVASDPLFTTGEIQGMVDRRSPGQSYLSRATFTSTNRKLVATTMFAGYNYGNPGGAQKTHEADADLLYYFSKPAVPGHEYKGFTFHFRHGVRFQSGTGLPAPAGYGGPPLFKYDRYQLEYDF